MAVLFLVEAVEGKVKKNSFEVATYASKLAAQLGTDAVGLALGKAESSELEELGAYGVGKILHAADDALSKFDSNTYASAVAEVAKSQSAQVVILSQSTTGKAVAPRLSVKLEAGLVSGAIALPDTSNGFVVKKGGFSGKAFEHVQVNTDTKIVSVTPNAFGAVKGEGSASVESISVNVPAPGVKVLEVNRVQSDTMPLPEAELVVSAGRGLKGPENWGIVEEMAGILGATTACSRPVADVGWRPHHEHVGQTGVAIRPNLYIAIGISGAIQHLAGVNQSKVIVVINKDPEAPFFKAADYGIVGDAFDVVPKLNEALKKFKASQ